MRSWLSFENRLLLLLAIAEATLLLDRLSVGFLASFLSEDLHLTNLQLGLLSSLFSGSFAISGYAVSGVSDRTGQRWIWLLALIVLFSGASALSGFTTGFAQLAGVRVLLGLFEGPFLPIALALMGKHSSPHRRSFNLAFVQNFGAFVLAQLAGPIILVYFAVHHGWRAAFFFTAVPGIIVAVLMLGLSRLAPDVKPIAHPNTGESAGLATPDSIWQRNVLLCVAIAACMGSWILLQMTFLPKYLVQVAGLDPTRMSFVMSVLGIGGCVSSLALPLLSDRFGRRAMLVCGTLIALSTPIGILFAYSSPAALTFSILVGSIAFGCSPLYVAIVPSESVGPGARARAVALVSASSAIMGGVVAPALAGRLADAYGLAMPFRLTAGLAVTAGLFACLLRPARPTISSAPERRSVVLRPHEKM